MTKIAEKLDLSELSLVDDPACQEAVAPIFKANSQKGEIQKMSDKMKARVKYYMETEKMSEEDATQAAYSEMEKAWESQEGLKAENERLRKALLDEGYTIKAETIEKAKEPEYIEVEGESILKSSIPEVILKSLEAAELEKADLLLEKKAEETLPNFDKAVAKKLLKSNLEEDVLQALKAADAAFDAVMSERGHIAKNGDMSDPKDQLDAKIAEVSKANNVTKEKAFEILMKDKEGLKLINKAHYEKDS